MESVKIKAEGSFGGLSEEQVVFIDGVSDWINFTTEDLLPDFISTHDVQWIWKYYKPENESWEDFSVTSHTLYGLNKKPITNTIYENLTRWTTKWCEDLPDDDKQLANAILNGFAEDKYISYGGPGWDTAEILRTGDGMCSGMAMVFFDACAVQGVKVVGLYFQLKDTSFFDPQSLWNGIVCRDPGLGRTEPGFASLKMIWNWVNVTYPYPRYFGQGNVFDDVDEEYTRAYIFYRFDGHVVNLLDYNDEILLYDLSFGKGPYENTFIEIPKAGRYSSNQIHDFRKNYHDIAVDHMNGRIYYEDNEGEIILDRTNFSIKTSIIPDEIDGENQLSYSFYIGNYARPKYNQLFLDQTIEYKEFFDYVKEKTELFKISIEEKDLLYNWLKTPLYKVNWIVIRNALLKLVNSNNFFELLEAIFLLKSIINEKTEMNIVSGCPLPGFMSPLNMVKEAAITCLIELIHKVNSKVFYNIIINNLGVFSTI
jgi:hypothetical protein